MSIKQTAFGRQARSVCILTDLPVRLQAKKKRAKHEHIPSAQLVRIGDITALIYLNAMGELMFETEPP